VAGEAENPRLGVLQFCDNAGTDRVAQDAITVRNLVESGLIVGGKYRILVQGALDKILAREQIVASEISDEQTLKKLRKLDIDFLVTGSVNAIGRDYAVTIKMFDIAAGQFCHSVSNFIMGSPRSLYEGVRTLTTHLVNEIGTRLSRKQTEPLTDKPDDNALLADDEPRISAIKTPALITPSIEARDQAYQIGDQGPGKGFIFYVDEDSYMEVSPILGEFNWEQAMKAAKAYNGGGFSDWYLPGKVVLNRIYENLQKSEVVNLGKSWYWSSTQHYFNDAWYQGFADGYQDYSPKSDTYSVRTVRGFYLINEE
jgi:hypothetical protein